MILARISTAVEEQLTPDQAGFRPGKSFCDQLLNLTQFIEDGFEEKKITGTVFVDLTAAYDTVNHRLLLNKVAKVVKNSRIVTIIQSLLSNRRFYVEMDGIRKMASLKVQSSRPHSLTSTRIISQNSLQSEDSSTQMTCAWQPKRATSKPSKEDSLRL